MKKIVSAIILAFVISLLGVSVFAQGEMEVKSVAVSITSPVKDQTVKNVKKDDVKIQVTESGSLRTLSAKNNEFAISPESGWYENNTGTEVKLKETDTFISGRSYILRVMFTINLLDCEIDGNTSLYLGSKKATLSKKGSQMQGTTEYMLSATFVCTSDSLAPMVSLSLEGEEEKVFDGKEVILSASVQQDEGVNYAYQWYRDDEKLEGETASFIKIRNVIQSGEYYCTVFATVSDDPNEEPAVTESASYEIQITPRSVVIQIENSEKNLFDEDPDFTYTVMGTIFDPLEGSLERKEGEDIGSYPITAGTLAFPASFQDNYEVEIKEGKLTILTPGQLPFSAVASLADLSYITGAMGSKVRVSASKGALPEGAVLSLRYPDEKVSAALKSVSNRGVMKSFTVSVQDAKGNPVELPKHATLRFQIPLTEEEAAQDPETLTACLYTGSARTLDTSYTVTQEGVTYIVVEIKTVGSIALFNGEAKAAVVPDSSENPIPGEKDEGILMWVLIGVIFILAVVGIEFTVLWTLKNRKKPEQEGKAGSEKKETPPLSQEEAGEKERIRRIAEEVNGMPPVPEKEESDPEKQTEKKVISFEDLEG